MHSIRIGVVFIIFIVYGVSSLQSSEFDDDSTPLPFQDKTEEIFDAFAKGDIARMEENFELLESVDPDALNNLDESNQTPDYKRNRIDYVPNRIKAAGYPAETHQIITEDEYILHAYRIPYGKKSPQTNQTRPIVLLMHGLLDSSNGFIVLAENSLAYLLADAGYDVWLANARGTEPSRTHVSLNPNGLRQRKYWSFSWHEIGVYDTPAIIDHMLNVTNQKKLTYVGFSQGTTTFLAFASMRPEYNEKLEDVHLLAPVSGLKNIRRKLYISLARFYTPLKRLSKIFRLYKITFGSNVLTLLSKMMKILCKQDENPSNVCKITIDSILGPCHINATIMSEILAYTPAGSSMQNIIHYGQIIRKKEFRLFDYDSERKNQRVYGKSTPPLYNLTTITAPVNLYFSNGDDLATLQDAIDLRNQLPNTRSFYLVPIDDFSHIDFGFSYLAKPSVYDQLISNINQITRLI